MMALLHEDSHKNQGQGQQFGHMILTVNSGWLTLYKTCNQLIFEIKGRLPPPVLHGFPTLQELC